MVFNKKLTANALEVRIVGFYHHHGKTNDDHKHRLVQYLHSDWFLPEMSRICSDMCDHEENVSGKD